jgi:putative transposase
MAAEIVENAIGETLSYYRMPSVHWRNLRTNDPLERRMREIRRRTRVVGALPDGKSVPMLRTKSSGGARSPSLG